MAASPDPSDPNFRRDSFGHVRRICDEITPPPYPARCSHYATHQRQDGAWACNSHGTGFGSTLREARRRRRIEPRRLCEHPTMWAEGPKRGQVRGLCTQRGLYQSGGKWYCRGHDPEKPRCEMPDCPTRAIGRFDGVRMCMVHAAETGSELAREAVRNAGGFARPGPKCNLCGGKGILRDDDERPFACVCTPAGRMLVNGGRTDAEVRAALEAE